ncbi:hypothetical protein MXD60_22385, partial [Frankia sp. AgB32]|nr:hypothetical protein [Frankia sp. AgB32]
KGATLSHRNILNLTLVSRFRAAAAAAAAAPPPRRPPPRPPSRPLHTRPLHTRPTPSPRRPRQLRRPSSCGSRGWGCRSPGPAAVGGFGS